MTQTGHYLQDGGAGEVNTGRIAHTGYYLQDGWCRRGQYRTDYTKRPLSKDVNIEYYKPLIMFKQPSKAYSMYISFGGAGIPMIFSCVLHCLYCLFIDPGVHVNIS